MYGSCRQDDFLISLRGAVDDLEHGCNIGLVPFPDHPAPQGEVKPIGYSRSQQPHPQRPLPPHPMVLPLSGTNTGTLTAFWKAAVLLVGTTLPSTVAGSLTWVTMTDFGRTSSFTTKAASLGPVILGAPATFITTRFAPWYLRT